MRVLITMPASAEAPSRIQPPTLREPVSAQNGQPGVPRVRLGPLLAVCGLAGGAGTTTIAYLVALAAAIQWRELVLVADTGAPSGGLAACAGVQTPHSLPELATALATGVSPNGGFLAAGPAGLRVLASGPAFGSSCAEEQLRRLLLDAREAHVLTVVDCGTLAREVDLIAAAAATHIAWVMPATVHGVRSAARVLDAAPHLPGSELLVARREVRQPKAPLRELRRIADERPRPVGARPRPPEPRGPRRSTRGRRSAAPGTSDPRSAAPVIGQAAPIATARHRQHSVAPTAQLRPGDQRAADTGGDVRGSRGGSPPC